MDQELKTFLEEQFARTKQETAEQFAQVKQETAEQFARARQETAEQFARARQETAEQFVQAQQETAEQFAEVHTRLTTLEERIHLTQVTVEGLRGDIRMVAEGVMGVTERLETFQTETARNFQEVMDSRAPVFRELGHRITAHDNHIEDLNSRIRHVDDRVRTLEARAERQTTDVIEAIRQKFGKSQES